MSLIDRGPVRDQFGALLLEGVIKREIPLVLTLTSNKGHDVDAEIVASQSALRAQTRRFVRREGLAFERRGTGHHDHEIGGVECPRGPAPEAAPVDRPASARWRAGR